MSKKNFVPKLRNSRSLDAFAEKNVEYQALCDHADAKVDAADEDFLPDDFGDYSDSREEVAVQFLENGLELFQKACKKDKHIYCVNLLTPNGNSYFYFIAATQNEVKKRLQRLVS